MQKNYISYISTIQFNIFTKLIQFLTFQTKFARNVNEKSDNQTHRNQTGPRKSKLAVFQNEKYTLLRILSENKHVVGRNIPITHPCKQFAVSFRGRKNDNDTASSSKARYSFFLIKTRDRLTTVWGFVPKVIDVETGWSTTFVLENPGRRISHVCYGRFRGIRAHNLFRCEW